MQFKSIKNIFKVSLLFSSILTTFSVNAQLLYPPISPVTEWGEELIYDMGGGSDVTLYPISITRNYKQKDGSWYKSSDFNYNPNTGGYDLKDGAQSVTLSYMFNETQKNLQEAYNSTQDEQEKLKIKRMLERIHEYSISGSEHGYFPLWDFSKSTGGNQMEVSGLKSQLSRLYLYGGGPNSLSLHTDDFKRLEDFTYFYNEAMSLSPLKDNFWGRIEGDGFLSNFSQEALNSNPAGMLAYGPYNFIVMEKNRILNDESNKLQNDYAEFAKSATSVQDVQDYLNNVYNPKQDAIEKQKAALRKEGKELDLLMQTFYANNTVEGVAYQTISVAYGFAKSFNMPFSEKIQGAFSELKSATTDEEENEVLGKYSHDADFAKDIYDWSLQTLKTAHDRYKNNFFAESARNQLNAFDKKIADILKKEGYLNEGDGVGYGSYGANFLPSISKIYSSAATVGDLVTLRYAGFGLTPDDGKTTVAPIGDNLKIKGDGKYLSTTGWYDGVTINLNNVESLVVQDSDKLVTSGAVYKAIDEAVKAMAESVPDNNASTGTENNTDNTTSISPEAIKAVVEEAIKPSIDKVNESVASVKAQADRQASTTKQIVTNVIGGGADVKEDGSITTPQVKITDVDGGEKTYTNLVSATVTVNENVMKVNERVTRNEESIRNLGTIVTENSAKIESLKHDVASVRKEANAVAASALAAASLPQAPMPGKVAVSMAGASIGGQSGYAIGVSKFSESGKFMLKANVVGNSQSKYGVGVGAAIIF